MASVRIEYIEEIGGLVECKRQSALMLQRELLASMADFLLTLRSLPLSLGPAIEMLETSCTMLCPAIRNSAPT
ncbi:hypothetical protein KT71_001381 [Congregibacter litoralis KT71]|uniref:Uncharacterized protein n=1 Tax=Congregibacter litoralis KT71 TaxID=314285 RepID=V7HUS0_9GAMM|nr:hypothetical protein KT71_001381 [Congregibacter litoralis KT71]